MTRLERALKIRDAVNEQGKRFGIPRWCASGKALVVEGPGWHARIHTPFNQELGSPCRSFEIIEFTGEGGHVVGRRLPYRLGLWLEHGPKVMTLEWLPYRELIAVTEFVNGFTPFATQHSVKGAEFENVLVILSGGWNHYNWPQFFELLTTAKITEKNTGGFHRCRNLFYVAVSRPKNRLAVLATQALNNAAMEAVSHLFGAENAVALPIDG